MYDVITVGAGVIDAFIKSKAIRRIKSASFSTGEGECFALGSKIEVEKFFVSTGGGATNTAVTFTNLGLKTAAVTRVGDDLFGRMIEADLETRGVGTEFLNRAKKERTGFSTILIVPSGERTVLVFRGASGRLNWREFKPDKMRARWFYVSSLFGNLGVAKKLFALAKQRGVPVFWNPGSKELKQSSATLKPFLNLAHTVMVNREEAALLTGRSLSDIRGMMSEIVSVAPQVIITDGPKGSYYSDGKNFYFANTRGIKAVSALGAGDGFGSGFLVGLMKWNDPVRALQLATVNAEGVIQKMGAKEGILKQMPSKAILNKIRVKLL